MTELPCRVAPGLWLLPEQVELTHVRASGPGGQNVNKVSTAVQLRFDARNHPDIGPDMFARLEKLAGARMSREGHILFLAQSFRSQERNRLDAIGRLVALLHKSTLVPRKRKPTRATFGSRERRLEGKERRGTVKSMRGRPSVD